MAKQRNIIDFDINRRSHDTGFNVTLPQLVVSAQRTAKHYLRELLPKFFSSVDDCLFDLADKADNNQQQTLYFDAMRGVRLQKEAMQEAYFKALTRAFDTAPNQPLPQQQNASSLDQISLVEDDQLEESLAITNMVNGAENAYREALFALTARMDFLIDDIDITKDNNPLRPEVLCAAFTPAVETMEVDIKVRLVVYKLFDKFVAQKLGPLYDAINADLIAAGVLPRIKSTIRKSPDNYAPYPAAGGAETATEAGLAAAMSSLDPSQPEGMFGSLQQLLSMQRAAPLPGAVAGVPAGGGMQPGGAAGIAAGGLTGTGGSTAGGETAVYFAPQDILSALSQLQMNSEFSPQQGQGQPSANIIKATLVEHIGQGDGGKQIGQADTDAIDIVSMLFDFILDDPSLHDNLKAQIARLQIPLLKVAILDKEFFAHKSHPARQLLNELAYAGSGLEEMDPEEDAVYQMVSYVVDSVLAEFEDNTEIFATLLAEFSEFVEKERESNRLAEEMLEQAKDVVAGEIQRRITDNRVPPLVSTILISAWKDVLTHLYLRDGSNSRAWNTALQVADDLVWSVQPKLVVSERQRLIKVIPRVLNGLRDGLTLIRFDAEATERLFSGLEALHLASLRGGLTEATEATPTEKTTAQTAALADDDFGVDLSSLAPGVDENPSGPEEDNLLEEIILASSQALPWEDEALNHSAYTAEVRDMALGTWVEFIDPETERRSRGKLAWKCDFTGEYTFVDRKYKVVADISNRQLIEEFELGRAAIVEDVPLFDRALDSVINGIKQALDRKGDSADPMSH
jgi:hypothetical protein